MGINLFKDIRTANVAKNALASMVMKIITLVCSFIIIPMTINYLTPEAYGIWIAMSSILFWFAFFDIGLGNGMRNFLAEAWSVGNYNQAQRLFSTTMVITTGIALLLGIFSIPIAYGLDLNSVFNTDALNNNSLANILSIAIIFSLCLFVVKNINLVYIAMQKYAISDFITFIGTVLTMIIIYILTQTMESSLIKVVIVFTGIPVLVSSLAIVPLLLKHPELTPSFNSLDLTTAKKIVSKGIGFFVIQITSCLVIFGSANIFISHYCGPEQVTVYNVSYKLFNILVIFFTILISPLWSAYTDAAAKDDFNWIKSTFNKTIRIWGLSVIAGIILLGLSGWFIDLWIGHAVKVPFAVSASIMLYVCFFNLNNCATYLINGLNKIRVQVVTSILMTVLYFVAVAFIGGSYGIVGISLAMTIAYALMAAIHLYQCYLLVNQKALGIWNK